MSLHNDIMNLQVDPLIEQLPAEIRITFKNGHKVARHAAAELSLKYERALEHAMEILRDVAESGSDGDSAYCEASLIEIKDILEEK